MSLWTSIVRFDAKARRVYGLYIVFPGCLLLGVFGATMWARTSYDHHQLAQRPITTEAVVRSVTQTGGRRSQRAVVSEFRTPDGKMYSLRTLHPLEATSTVEPGVRHTIIYENGNPANSSLTLDYARANSADARNLMLAMLLVSALLGYVYRHDLKVFNLWVRRFWRRSGSASGPAP